MYLEIYGDRIWQCRHRPLPNAEIILGQHKLTEIHDAKRISPLSLISFQESPKLT